VRPDAGTLLESQRQQPAIPAPGGDPAVQVRPAPAAATFDRSVVLTPAAFRVEGNTVFAEGELQAVLAPFVNHRMDMGGLLEAAAAVRQYYRDRGHLLTEAYLPQQQFSASGGVVTIRVLEARVGRASARVEGSGPSPALVESIVRAHLPPGTPITEYALEKPILLLRDLPGFDATADVQPGAQPGEADVVVVVRPAGKRVAGLIGVDNYGPRAVGAIRGYVEAEANNLAGHGDVLGVRLQRAQRSGSDLYRLGYSTAFGPGATRVGLQLAHAEYALGKQFAALGATGDAQVASLTVTQPLVRSRKSNLFGVVALEHKELDDRTATPASSSERRVESVRVSALGNFADSVAGNAFTSYALSLTHGRVRMDATTLALDQGVGGPDTAGSFGKFNVDVQRSTFFTAQDRVHVGLQAQFASRNLTSAEKMSLGGPNGVRGYPVSEAVGDSGVLASVEYRHQFAPVAGVPLSAAVFYDWGQVKFNQDGAIGAGPNRQTLGSAGLGFSAGAAGDYLLSLQLAWRTTSKAPASDPDRRPRVWLSLQKWL
jgi:hemolysin activation/secretion protein